MRIDLLRGRAGFPRGATGPALVDADPAGTFFHTPAYLKLYWEEFGETPDHLLLAFAEEDDGTQVGAVAFERIGTTLRFLGGTEVTDYMGPVAMPERAGRDRGGALGPRSDAARGLGRRPTCGGSPRTAGLVGSCGTPPPAAGSPSRRRDDQNGVAPFLALPRDVGRLPGALPAKLRHEIKRKARKLEAEDAGRSRS